jgi:serine protease Do
VAKPVVNQLIKHGHVRRGWLGVHIQTVSEEIAESLGLEKAEGALVANVIKDGPAEKAGIQAGDVIIEFDNKKVAHMRRLPRIVAETNIEKPVSVLLWRDSRKVTVKVTVGELEEDQPKVASRGGSGKDQGEHKVESLGLTLSTATKRLRERFNLKEDIRGVVVVSVDEDGPAAKKGIRPGDVVVELGQQEVTTPGEVLEMVKKTKESGRKSVLMLLKGRGGLRFVALRIAQG